MYAIGDIVAGLPQLAHVGADERTSRCRESSLENTPDLFTVTGFPGCTYCDPQIGSVGLTEAQAKEKGYQVKVGKFPFVGKLQGDDRGLA